MHVGVSDKLGIYLNDHLAGAAAGIALAKRCRGSNPEPPLGPMLSELLDELHVDKQLLVSIMAAHGIRQNPLKQAGAIAAERMGRLKFNGSVRTYSPLSRVLELEGLRVGVFAKRAMWEALLTQETLAPEPKAIQAAIQRANAQIERLEDARRTAIADAFLVRSRA